MDQQVLQLAAEYQATKAAGTMKIIKLHGIPHYTGKRYDVTGKATPFATSIDEKKVKEAIAGIQQQILNFGVALKGAEQLLADIEAAPELAAK